MVWEPHCENVIWIEKRRRKTQNWDKLMFSCRKKNKFEYCLIFHPPVIMDKGFIYFPYEWPDRERSSISNEAVIQRNKIFFSDFFTVVHKHHTNLLDSSSILCWKKNPTFNNVLWKHIELKKTKSIVSDKYQGKDTCITTLTWLDKDKF